MQVHRHRHRHRLAGTGRRPDVPSDGSPAPRRSRGSRVVRRPACWSCPSTPAHGTFIAGVADDAGRSASSSSTCSSWRRAEPCASRPWSQPPAGAGRRRSRTIINLSAGCHTCNNLPLKAFQLLWHDDAQAIPRTPCWWPRPATTLTSDPSTRRPSSWAVGVGSLDHDGERLELLQLRQLRRRLRPRSQPRQRVPPRHVRLPRDAGQGRRSACSTDGLARWSGTSFAAPLVAGLIAAQRIADDQHAGRCTHARLEPGQRHPEEQRPACTATTAVSSEPRTPDRPSRHRDSSAMPSSGENRSESADESV